MSGPMAIEEATKRLHAALESLEAALERRVEAAHSQAELAAQVHAFETDRSRLAAQLDAMAAHSRQLESTNRDVAARLDAAIEGIRTVIDAHDR